MWATRWHMPPIWGLAAMPLTGVMACYQNRSIVAAQGIEEWVQMAKKFHEAAMRGEQLGLAAIGSRWGSQTRPPCPIRSPFPAMRMKRAPPAVVTRSKRTRAEAITCAQPRLALRAYSRCSGSKCWPSSQVGCRLRPQRCQQLMRGRRRRS